MQNQSAITSLETSANRTSLETDTRLLARFTEAESEAFIAEAGEILQKLDFYNNIVSSFGSMEAPIVLHQVISLPTSQPCEVVLPVETVEKQPENIANDLQTLLAPSYTSETVPTHHSTPPGDTVMLLDTEDSFADAVLCESERTPRDPLTPPSLDPTIDLTSILSPARAPSPMGTSPLATHLPSLPEPASPDLSPSTSSPRLRSPRRVQFAADACDLAATANPPLAQALVAQALAGDPAVVAAVAGHAAAAAVTDTRGRGLVHAAAEGGHADLCTRLIGAGVPLLADAAGNTPLHTAATAGHAAACSALLAAGVALDATNIDGQTALHAAAAGAGPGTVVPVLVAAGAAPMLDRNGRAPRDLLVEADKTLSGMLSTSRHRRERHLADYCAQSGVVLEMVPPPAPAPAPAPAAAAPVEDAEVVVATLAAESSPLEPEEPEEGDASTECPDRLPPTLAPAPVQHPAHEQEQDEPEDEDEGATVGCMTRTKAQRPRGKGGFRRLFRRRPLACGRRAEGAGAGEGEDDAPYEETPVSTPSSPYARDRAF